MASHSPSPTASDFSSSYYGDLTQRYLYHNQQPIPRSYPDPQPENVPLPPLTHENSNESTRQQQEKVRLRKACDSCSVRKVKCDESGPPCRSCAALDIPCTFKRPSRRRGPPNRHAEAFKRQKLEHDDDIPAPTDSPTKDAAASLASLSGSLQLSAESICHIKTLESLLDDYFTYIHPLIPLPHEPSFREGFARREDKKDRTFLALLAAMIEILVVSFPRRPRRLFATESARKRFPTAEALIAKCHQVYIEARGPHFLDRQLNIYDATASYLVGTAAAYSFDMRRNRLYSGEGVMIMRSLGLHWPRARLDQADMSPQGGGYILGGGPKLDDEVDFVTQEVARRLFWLFYVGCCSVRQFGSADGDLVMPPLTYAEQFPPMPLELDDQYILPDRILPQPPGLVSEMVGFNLNVMVFRSYSSLTSFEMAFGSNELYDWDRQRRMIVQTLRNVKSATSTAPPELQLNLSAAGVWPWPAKSTETSPRTAWADAVGINGHRRTSSQSHANYFEHGRDRSEHAKRQVQCEIQKANIYASQLGSRSYLVEKYWNLFELQDRHNHRKSLASPSQASPPSSMSLALNGQLPNASPTLGCIEAGVDRNFLPPIPLSEPSGGSEAGEQIMAIEREDIVRDLAVLLQSISQVSMEPNGLSFCHKIRQVASTLLETPRSRMAMPSLDSESVNVYLTGFLDIIIRLERLGPSRIKGTMNGMPPNESYEGGGYGGAGEEIKTAEEIEEEELVHWASLKEHQEKFVREQGFSEDLL